MPRSVPAAETDALAWATCSGWPTASMNGSALNHSRKAPRASPWTWGVNTNAPLIESSAMSTAFLSLVGWLG